MTAEGTGDSPPAFFERTPGGLVPRPHARSPWAPDMLHGRLLAALASAEVERQLGEPMRLVRLTTDLFRVAPMRPVVVTITPTREGRRIRTFTVDLACDGRVVATTAALALAESPPPAGRSWSAPPWSAPAPETLTGLADPFEADPPGSPDLRLLGGRLEGPGPHHAWLREPWPLVEGEPLSATTRAVMAADVANPLTNWTGSGLQYINADLSVHLARAPIGEWIGLEVVDHLAGQGITVGTCRLHDRTGPFGQSVVSGLARPFPPVGPADTAGLRATT